MQFNYKFLEEIGAANLSKEQKRRLLAVIREEVEVRVGSQMCAELSREQIHEFEIIIDGDVDFCSSWLREHCPQFETRDAYRNLEKSGLSGDNLLCETASVIWIQFNKPNYRNIVNMTSEIVKNEIIANLPIVLAEISVDDTG